MYQNVEALRADAKRIKSLLRAEQQIRARLADKRMHEREKWLRKYREAHLAEEALDRLLDYISSTDPEERLGTLPTQITLIE